MYNHNFLTKNILDRISCLVFNHIPNTIPDLKTPIRNSPQMWVSDNLLMAGVVSNHLPKKLHLKNCHSSCKMHQNIFKHSLKHKNIILSNKLTAYTYACHLSSVGQLSSVDQAATAWCYQFCKLVRVINDFSKWIYILFNN